MYFPWSGFFELVSCADVYVHLDDVQFSKGSFTNRIQVKRPQGAAWMTVPLAGKGSFTAIRDLQASDPGFTTQHRALLQQSLCAAPHWPLARDAFAAACLHEPLVRLLAASIEGPLRALEVPAPREFLWSSALGLGGRSSTRVLDIVKHLGGTRYVTAHGAADYLDHAAFERAGVAVEYINYSRTPYPQGPGHFTPFVTILDLLAHVGPVNAACFRRSTVPWRAFLAARAAPAGAQPS